MKLCDARDGGILITISAGESTFEHSAHGAENSSHSAASAGTGMFHRTSLLHRTSFQPQCPERGTERKSICNTLGSRHIHAVSSIGLNVGWTSFTVCAKLRSLTKAKKVGHAGTLDPMATGLLILCLGKATKVVDRYQAMTKVYSGTLRLGELTPSADADTEVTDRLPWEHIQDTDLEAAAQKFLGEILQVPPMYSAIKVKGERLYEKARRVEELDIPSRTVTVSEFQLTRSEHNRQDVDFRVVCSKGTYIRSLCTDVGLALNSYAHLIIALRRESIGDLSVEDAWTVADLQLEYSRLYL